MSAAPATDFVRQFRDGPYAPFLRELRGIGSRPVRLLAAGQPAGEYPDPPAPDLWLGLLLRGDGAHEVDVGAGRWRGRCGPGAMALAPPGAATHFAQDGPAEFLFAVLPSAALAPLLEDAARAGGGRPDFGRLHAAPFRDPFVEHLVRRLWDEAAGANPHGALFADGALVALAGALLGLAHRGRLGPAGAGPPPRRPDRRVARAVEHLRARLGEDVTMPELAREAGLSERGLYRSFKAATGLAPHAFLAERRVERAKELLCWSDLPLAEVALACGFKGQSHFGQAFRRLVGSSPGAYRRERRS